jgi:hypothetical protein
MIGMVPPHSAAMGGTELLDRTAPGLGLSDVATTFGLSDVGLSNVDKDDGIRHWAPP